MSKKPGQISSNTLSLRFMQNAAKAKQESEVKAAKAKVRTDEEWELSPDIKQSWGIGDGKVKDQGHVTYEQSYLPFLFPRFSSNVTVPVTSTTAESPNQSESEGDEAKPTSTVLFQRRRTFGKHGKEETAKPSLPPVQQPPLNGGHSLSLEAGSISSHGPNSTSSSTLKPRPPRHPIGLPSSSATLASGSAGFKKPQVDGPRHDHGGRKKRPSSDVEGPTDGNMKKKNRKDKKVLNIT